MARISVPTQVHGTSQGTANVFQSYLNSQPMLIMTALLTTGTDFSLIALIDILKQNAIMMIDFALHVEREQGLSPCDSIFEACLLRFRPIIMSTMASMLDAGDGAELRPQPGIPIVGGLIMSQLLTLYATTVVYLYMDRFRLWSTR